MARRKKQESSDDDSEDWMTTYADAITLLMAFFVMLVSFSKVDLKVFEDVQAGIEEAIGGVVEEETPIYALETKMQDAISEIVGHSRRQMWKSALTIKALWWISAAVPSLSRARPSLLMRLKLVSGQNQTGAGGGSL